LPAPARPRVTRFALWIAGAIGFLVLATFNTAGYRYGAADQAFYIPAVLQQLDPTLYPRDAALIVSQGRFSLLEELFAALIRATGWSLSTCFALCYVLALVLVFAGLVQLGRRFYTSPRAGSGTWSTAALLLAYTLRHRITRTGVNTLEGYFQPRMLTFGLGLLAMAAVMKKRPALAWALLIAGAFVHTTTAIWFFVVIGVALAVEDARQRKWILAAAVAGAGFGLVLLWHGTLSLAPMDEAWMRAFEGKDYIFPTEWPIDAWLTNLLLPTLIVCGYAWRRRAGVVAPGETGIVAGNLTLVAMFLVALPFIASHSALVAQLQVSRLFWLNDLLATVYVVWMATEALAPRGAPIVVALLALLSIGRGWYVLRVDHPGRPAVEIDLPQDDWTDASSWLRTHMPKDAHLLADPGHAWRYGLSLRVSAERDVLLEDVKDASIALYGRPIALRVTERRAALGDFSALTVEDMRALASRYDLDYLVIDRAMPLPEVYRNGTFFIYRLSTRP
jgi:hypothetical protein